MPANSGERLVAQAHQRKSSYLLQTRLPSLFLQNFQYPGNSLADVVPEFLHGVPLRIAAGEGWNFCPESAFRIFVDDNCVLLHVWIFSQWPTDVRTTVRTIETAWATGSLDGETSIFIYPGFEFRRVGSRRI